MHPGKLLVFVLVVTTFEMSPAFTGAPARRALPTQGRNGRLCLFSNVPPSMSKTRRVAAGPARQPDDPMTYGQRIYPVHPLDLSPEDRRNGLVKLVMLVGVRDCIVGLLVASAFFIAAAGLESKDFHLPVVPWFLSCILVGRVFHEGLAPTQFNFDHKATGVAGTAKSGALRRSDSFSQWRGSAISPDIQVHALPRPPNVERTLVDKPRLLVEYSEATATNADDQDLPLRAFKVALGTLVWGFVSDIVDALKWFVAPKSNSEPNPGDPRESSDFAVWDPRDADTPREPGV